jgi:hypothetical protein
MLVVNETVPPDCVPPAPRAFHLLVSLDPPEKSSVRLEALTITLGACTLAVTDCTDGLMLTFLTAVIVGACTEAV